MKRQETIAEGIHPTSRFTGSPINPAPGDLNVGLGKRGVR